MQIKYIQRIFLIQLMFTYSIYGSSDQKNYFSNIASVDQITALKREIFPNVFEIKLEEKESIFVSFGKIVYPETSPVIPRHGDVLFKQGDKIYPYPVALQTRFGSIPFYDLHLEHNKIGFCLNEPINLCSDCLKLFDGINIVEKSREHTISLVVFGDPDKKSMDIMELSWITETVYKMSMSSGRIVDDSPISTSSLCMHPGKDEIQFSLSGNNEIGENLFYIYQLPGLKEAHSFIHPIISRFFIPLNTSFVKHVQLATGLFFAL